MGSHWDRSELISVFEKLTVTICGEWTEAGRNENIARSQGDRAVYEEDFRHRL